MALKGCGKGTYIRALCQKKERSVEVKQIPLKMGGRTIHNVTVTLKDTFLKLGLSDDLTCERCPEKDEPTTHILCDCEAIAHLRFRHLFQFLWNQVTASDYYNAPLNKVLHFNRSVGLIKG
jgi:hypothetical protein